MRTLVLDGTPPVFDLGIGGKRLDGNKTIKGVQTIDEKSLAMAKKFRSTRNVKGKDDLQLQ